MQDITAAYLSVSDPVVYVYAIVAALISFQWVWAWNIIMWDTSDVDYILVLDLDSVKHMPTGHQVLREVSLYSILFLANAITFHLLRLYYIDNSKHSPSSSSSVNHILIILSQYVKIVPIILMFGGFLVVGKALSRKISYGVFSRKVIQAVSILFQLLLLL